jgi:hypothetical protein
MKARLGELGNTRCEVQKVRQRRSSSILSGKVEQVTCYTGTAPISSSTIQKLFFD